MASRRPTPVSVGTLLENQRLNAILAWAVVGLLGIVAVQAAFAGLPLWGIFAGVLLGIVVIPPLTYRRATVMLPWEVLALASFPILARSAVFQLAVPGLAGRLLTYLAAAAAALVIAVELDVFTPVRMPDWLAVVFVILATIAAAGMWAVTAWLSDLWLGTTFILDPALSPHEQEALVMWDFVAATIGGIVAGTLFEFYFRRRSGARQRLPESVQEVIESQ